MISSVRKFYLEQIDEKVEDINDHMFSDFKKHFLNAFSKLAPKGNAQVDMINLEPIQSSLAAQGSSGDSRGIRVLAQFDGQASNTSSVESMMQSLSPGQRTVLSICILVALQQCNPSPFYCFDEIDADLDANTTKLVSKLIQNISENSQVFLTTFRPESLGIKNSSIFQVEMERGQSVPKSISLNEAKELLARQ